MMCKSKSDLKEYGGNLFGLQKSNNELYQSVLTKYYPNTEYYDVWIIENIHNLCNEVLDDDRFIVSELYHILNELYDLCEWIILWYGGEYNDLEEVHSKNEFLNCVKCCMENPCCEIYLMVHNY